MRSTGELRRLSGFLREKGIRMSDGFNVKEIQLLLTMEEFEILRSVMDFHDLNDYPDDVNKAAADTLYGKIVEIGRRLDFFKQKGKPIG